MNRLSLILAVLTVFGTVSSSAFAQWTRPLRSERDAADFCRYSEPRTDGESAQESADKKPGTDEAYDTARRNRAQRPVVVWVDATTAPVIGYDRVTGMLELSLYRPARFADSHAVAVKIGTVSLETTEENAHHLWARYEAGTARLKLTLLPAAWSDYDRPLCRESGQQHVVDGEVLEAELVDEVDKRIIGFRTQLGHEVAMMREHRIRGYLDSGMPVVTVSTLTPLKSDVADLDDVLVDRMKSSIRASVYGCYLKGLSDNARLQGALVMKVSASREPPTVLVDSLHDTKTSVCVLSRVADVVRKNSALPPGIALKTTLMFRLEDGGSL